MRLSSQNFFCDKGEGPALTIDEDRKDICGWPITLKLSANGYSSTITIFMASHTDLVLFKQSFDTAFNDYMKPEVLK